MHKNLIKVPIKVLIDKQPLSCHYKNDQVIIQRDNESNVKNYLKIAEAFIQS